MRTTISFTREGMGLIQEAAKRQGSSVSQVVREAALMRATMVTNDSPYPAGFCGIGAARAVLAPGP
jgi:uncharacterized protein (DUF1778 family)